MKRLESTLVWGVLLVIGGVLFLLQNLRVLGPGGTLLWAFLFLIAGAIFLYVFFANRARWWALMPGFALVSLAVLMAIQELAPELGRVIGGSIFLGGLALSFWVVYLLNRQNWWAVIPGGALLTLAVVAALGSLGAGAGAGAVFFLGAGLTFALLAFVPTPKGRLKWAFIPAAACLVMALIVAVQFVAVFQYLWPVALIAAGAYLVLRSPLGKKRE